MDTRGHLQPAELDALLLDSNQGSGVTVETFHIEGCRTCREALLDLALMAGLLRGAPLRPDLEIVHDLVMDAPEASLADAVVSYERMTASTSRKATVPRHPPDDALQALLACAFDERLGAPSGFFADVRHVSRCDQCLTRVLRLSARFAPPARMMSAILKATGKGPSRPQE